MAKLQAVAYQFLSLRQALQGAVRCPARQTGITIIFEFTVVEKPFDISFASISGRNPDIGPIQYVNPSDRYADMRWPTCVQANVSIETDRELSAAEALNILMLDTRDAMYAVLSKNPLFDITGHISSQVGYRRSYAAKPDLDIAYRRRPQPSEYYHPTLIGEYLGPGLITITDASPRDFVWSQIIPFPNATNIATDLPRLREIINVMRLHYNGYNELRDARGHLKRAAESEQLADIKTAIRSAASGIEPLMLFYCELHRIKFPQGPLSFDQKIESLLAASGMPSYRTINANGLALIGKLYRARNSMHEGDAYFKEPTGLRVKVDLPLAEKFVDAAEQFAIWIDSLA
jgi:hypothetical protein